MDLNVSPSPEEDEEPPKEPFGTVAAPAAPEESSVEIARREREERRLKLKMERRDDRPVQSFPKSNPCSVIKRRYFDSTKLPPGWLDCPSYGKEICGIIPSKAPLGESFNEYIAPGGRYSSKQIIQRQRVLGRTIGLVVDLTNTDRYYEASDWKREGGISHLKIQCKGRDSVPNNESVNSFVYEVSRFFTRYKVPKKCVLVHCTHGHNRTGYMIVHYLVRTQQISVSEAIWRFAEARPPGIYKPDYIDALYTFYHECKPEKATCPPTPEWKKPSDLDLNGEAVPDVDDDDDVGHPASPLHDNNVAEVIMTNDDVLGDKIPYAEQTSMQNRCYELLFGAAPSGPSTQFPGSHPVSLNRENLQLLRQRYYYATWKADGTRYMMLITVGGCFLIDRKFCFRRVQMRFPYRKTNMDLHNHHHYTLLDGEMIIDTCHKTKKRNRRYLIYDLMAINGTPVVKRHFNERWEMIEKDVIEPRRQEDAEMIKEMQRPLYERKKDRIYRYDWEPFKVRRKDFWLLSAVKKVLKGFIPNLPHEADGLILQCWDDTYECRTHECLLKWKYAEMNSVDFIYEGNESKQLLFLHDKGKKRLLDGNRVVFKDPSDAVSYSGKIIECSWDSNDGVWVCMRVRHDKSTPNDWNTYRKVMRSITDNITEEELLEEIEKIVMLPMYVENDNKAKLASKIQKTPQTIINNPLI